MLDDAINLLVRFEVNDSARVGNGENAGVVLLSVWQAS
jgi:hypothetical protein